MAPARALFHSVFSHSLLPWTFIHVCWQVFYCMQVFIDIRFIRMFPVSLLCTERDRSVPRVFYWYEYVGCLAVCNESS